MKEKTNTKKKKHRGLSGKDIALLTMVLPGTIWFILLRYIPMGGILLAFKDYSVWPDNPAFGNNLIHSAWKGLENFKFLFMTKDNLIAIRNTIVYNVIWIALGIIIAMFIAILLSEVKNKALKKTIQTTLLFPYFLSWIVVSYFVLAFLDPTRGMINHAMKGAGLGAIDWYNEPGRWPFILTFCYLWKSVGYTAVLYLTGLTSIDTAQYEAAVVDGASWWQKVWYITIPNLRPVTAMLIILGVGKIFVADFGLFYSVPMNSGTLYSTTQVIDTYIYQVFTTTSNLGMSTAGSLMQNVVGLILLLAANKVIKGVDSDYGII